MSNQIIEKLLLVLKVSKFYEDDKHFFVRNSLFCLLLFTFGASESAYAGSLYQTLCEKAGINRSQVRAYENHEGDYILNIQMFETYKHFRGCTRRDSTLKIDPSFGPQLDILEKELGKQQEVGSQEWTDLNRRSFEIFQETQAMYREYFEKLIGGRTSSLQKKVLRQIQKRVATVRIKKSRYCNSFNSNYNFVSHSIDTCNELLTYPRTTLIAIYAHELTHSIDPCSLQFSLSHIEQENPFSGDQLIEREVHRDAYTSLPLEWALEDLFLEKDQLQTVMSPLPFELNPFRRVLECLQSDESIQAKKRQHPLEKSNVKDKEHMCSSSLQDGQMAESFADWMAYEVLAYFLKKQKGPELKEQIFEGSLNIVANECPQLESDIEVEMRKAITASAQCRVDNEKFFSFQKRLRGQMLTDTHPHGELRINRLYGAHPTLYQLLQKYLRSDKDPMFDKAVYCK